MNTRQLHQVTLTYATRRDLWWLAIPGLLICGAVLPNGARSANSPEDAGVIAAAFTAYLASCLSYIAVAQAKWQFCDPRAQLFPHFASAHQTILLVLIIVCVGLYPFFLGYFTGWNPVGLAAYAVAVVASLIWAIQTNSLLCGGLGIGLIGSLATSAGAIIWLSPEPTLRITAIHLVVLAGGWTAILTWLARLVRIHEESGDYEIPARAPYGKQTRLDRHLLGVAVARYLARRPSQRMLIDRWHDKLVNVNASSIRSRQRLLRYGFTALPIWTSAVTAVPLVFIAFYLISSKSDGPSPILAVLFTAVSFGGPFIARRGRMPQELLLPFSRHAYVDGLFGTLASSAFIVWIILTVTMLAYLNVVSPHSLTASTVPAIAALVAATFFYCFGALPWIALKQSGFARISVLSAFYLPVMAILTVGFKGINTPPPPDRPHLWIYQSLEQVDLTPKQRAMVQAQIDHYDERLRDSEEINPQLSWWSAALLSIVGVTLFVKGRQKWLSAELA